MRRMKVGVLEVLSPSARPDWGRGRNFRRHFASITPQAVSVWCRQLGHDVTYATYYGQREPHTLLPEPLEYYDRMARLHASGYAWKTVGRRVATTASINMRILTVLRTIGGQDMLRRLRGIGARLRDDAGFRAFHEGAPVKLPDFYRRQYVARLGRYAGLLSESEMTPEPEAATPLVRHAPGVVSKPAPGLSRSLPVV